jgi:hypothetical protein
MATTAARINSSGTYFVNGDFDEVTQSTIKNLLTYTEQFNQSVWTKTRSSIGAIDTIVSPNGTLTAEKLIEDAAISSTHYLNSAYVTSVNLPTGSIYVKAGERTFCNLQMIRNNGSDFASLALVVNLTTGSILSGPGTVTDAGNGWYRLSITATTSGTNYAIRLQLYQSLGVNTYIGDGVSGFYIWGAQLENNSTVTPYQGIGAPGIIITPDYAIRVLPTGVRAAQFDEVTYSNTSPVIKNLLTNTEQFELWGNSLNIVTTNATTAPNGKLTADRIQVNNSGFTFLSINTVGGASYVFSFYVKSVSGTSGTWPVNYFTGVHNRSTVPITGEWSRQYITFTGTGGLVNVYAADNRSLLASITDAYVWGAQLERGTEPTIYQGIADANTLVDPGFAKREASDGSQYVTGMFDEVTGMIVTNGLILQLDPGKVESFRSTSTSFIDISDNTRNCSFIGAITYDSTSSSLLFDSPATTVDNRIALAAAGIDNTIFFTDGSEYTIEFWCKIASDAAATYHSIAGRGSTNPWLGIQKNASSYNLFFRQSGGTYFFSTTINVSVFTGWTQVVFSVNTGRVVSYYINHANGTFIDTDTVTNTFFTINRLGAGYSSGGAYYAFDGNIGPINIYNRALSAAEVNNNFEALRDRFGI